jgi:hypothetical protein
MGGICNTWASCVRSALVRELRGREGGTERFWHEWKVVLKLILKKCDVIVWVEFVSLRIVVIRRLL